MFTLQRLTFGTRSPLLTVYVDSLNAPYTIENVIVQATNADDVLDVRGVTAVCLFAGDAFPLSGADYLSPVTGTLSVTVTSALPAGLYRQPLRSLESVFPFAGMSLAGIAPAGLTGNAAINLITALQIQVLNLPANIALQLNRSIGGKPTAWGGNR